MAKRNSIVISFRMDREDVALLEGFRRKLEVTMGKVSRAQALRIMMRKAALGKEEK
jgi:hypothetical protein